MISHIRGKVKKKNGNSVFLDVSGITYEIMIPPAVLNNLGENTKDDGIIELITYHYHHLEPSRSVPILIGFLNEIEKEFFELFITVSGVGPKAACRALSAPISEIADAIYKGDTMFLKTLPGIGEQRAREIIAKLQGKVGKFGLIKDKGVSLESPRLEENIKLEALDILLQLQYKKKEAEEMIEKALKRNPELKSCEEILNEVYSQTKK